MNLPREIGWMRRKCEMLSDITNVMHTFTFDGNTIIFASHGNPYRIVASGTFEEFQQFQHQIYKYYDAVVTYYHQRDCVSNLIQPKEKFIYMGSYRRKVM